METKERNEKKGLRGGIFFNIFYLGFGYVVIVLLYLAQLIMTGDTDRKMLGKAVVALFFSLLSLWKFRRDRKKLLAEIFGPETDGIRYALEDTKLCKEAEKAVDLAIQFGYKNGVKRLERLQRGADSYDDKAVLYYIVGMLYETAGDGRSALWNYNRALQYRPCYRMAVDKVEELCKV